MQLIAITEHGCADTIRDTICVHPEIDVKFAIVPDTVGCQAYPAQLFNLSTGADTFYWDLGDDTTIVTDQDTTINHIWTNLNVVSPDSVYNVSLVGISSFGCKSDTTSDAIRVHPKPDANFTVDVDTGCSCFTVTITNLALGFDSLFWDFGDGSPSSTDTSSSLVHTYCNTTDSTINRILKLIAVTQYGCADTLTDTIKVHPEVTANFTVLDSIGCDPFAVCFFNLSLGEDSWNWDFGDGSSSTIENPCHTFINDDTTNLVDSAYIVELAVSSVFGCGSDTVRDTIIVHPTPLAGFTVDTNEGISPVVITITDLSTGADSVFWDFGDQTDTTTVSPTAPFTHIYTNTTGSIVTYQLCAIAQTNLGCTDTVCLPIKVHPEIDANFAIVPNDSGCHPFTIGLINLSLRADTFYWDFGDSSSIFVTTDKDTVITHTYYNSSAVNDTTYCITLIAVSDSGASDTMTQCIVVHPKPLADFSVDTNAGCSPLTITVFNTSTPFGSLNYFWIFSDSLFPNTTSSASFTKSYVNTSSTPSFYTIKLLVTNSNGCTDTLIDTITVYPEISAQFAIVPDTGCSPLDVTFGNLSAPVGTASYEWDFGDSLFSTDTNPTHQYLNPSLFDTTYYPCLIATTAFGCKDTVCDSVKIFSQPLAIFTMADTIGCSPLTVTFTNSSLYATSYLWVFGTGDSSTTDTNTFTYTFINNTDFAVSYTITLIAFQSSCTDIMTRTITLDGALADFAFFTITDSAGCTPLTITFQPTPGAANYCWDFDDGNTLCDTSSAPFSYTFYNPSNTTDSVYTVRLIATGRNGCIDTSYKDITVYPKPVASFNISDSVGCSPLIVTFNNTSLGATLYHWNFGKGLLDTLSTTSSASFDSTYSNNTANQSVIFQISLVSENIYGCKDSAVKNINVLKGVVISQINVFLDSIFCAPTTVQFTSTITGQDTLYWDFGDTQTSSLPNPIHTYTNPSPTADSNYTATLIASNAGCGDTAIINITAHPKPIADFSASDTIGCAPLTVTFTDASIGALTYIWDFGDNTFNFTPGSVSHTYYNPNINTDTLLMKLTVENADGCKDTLTQNIIVYPQITAYFLTNPDTAGCSPFTVNFNNQTFPPDSNSYQWDFGDGTGSSVLKNPSYTYINGGLNTDTNTVQLIAASAFSCSDTFYRDIIVFPKPVANFSVNVTSGCTPLDVTISNTSTPGATYYWDFGDGSTSTDTSGTFTHTYNNTSSDTTNYLLQLMAENSYGCRDTSTAQVVVTSLLVINVNFIDTVKTGNDGAIDITVSGGTPPYNFSWSNGAANEDIDSLTAGIYIVIVTDSSGCIDSMSIEVPNATGITETKLQNQVKLYPNPHNGKFNLSIQSKNNRKFSVYIYDVFGKLISEKKYIKENNLQIDISGQVKGIYFLKVIKDDQVSISKIICQ